MMKKIYCLLLTFIAVSCVVNDAQLDTDKVISVRELVDNKDKYHKQIVKVKAYGSKGFESCVIWPENPEEVKVPLEYWVWYYELNSPCEPVYSDDVSRIKYGYVIIEGVYNKNDKGHLGSYSSSIDDAKVQWLDKKSDK